MTHPAGPAVSATSTDPLNPEPAELRGQWRVWPGVSAPSTATPARPHRPAPTGHGGLLSVDVGSDNRMTRFAFKHLFSDQLLIFWELKSGYTKTRKLTVTGLGI